MRNDKHAPERVTEAVEIDDFVTHDGHEHRDQYAHFSHELAEDTAEAASRTLARIVPIAYGVLLGLTTNNLWLWTAGGVLLAIAIDLGNREHSLARQMAGRLHGLLCPLLGATTQAIVRLMQRRGLRAPTALQNLACGAA